jgi:hypothetical protein
MMSALRLVSMLVLLLPSLACADFYQWTDAQGVVHLTDDRRKIPKRYQGKAERLDVPDTPSKPAAAPEPRAASPAPEAQSRPPAPAGRDEAWWRGRYNTLRAELKMLQDARAQKEQRLVKLRRERAIFQRARDREAMNLLQGQINSDEARISQVLARLSDLEAEATRAAVPNEWRR